MRLVARANENELTPLEILQLKQKRTPPAGLYVAGTCPECGSPVYYHGPGTINVKGNAFTNDHTEEIPHTYFHTCNCEPEEALEVQVPGAYHYQSEREAVTSLFLNIMNMLEYIRQLESERESRGGGDEDVSERADYLLNPESM